MIVHMMVNLTALDFIGGPSIYQRAVYQIHSLGGLLPFVEWSCIFLPILFHRLIGLLIIREGLSNTGSYPYPANIRYSLQRITRASSPLCSSSTTCSTCMVGFIFMPGSRELPCRWAAAQFKPYNAASSLVRAISGFSGSGCLRDRFGRLHVSNLANGFWTMGITWGVWTSARAQQAAAYLCGMFGLFVGIVSVGRVSRRIARGCGLREDHRGPACTPRRCRRGNSICSEANTSGRRPGQRRRGQVRQAWRKSRPAAHNERG